MVFSSKATEDVLRVLWHLLVVESRQRGSLEQCTLLACN